MRAARGSAASAHMNTATMCKQLQKYADLDKIQVSMEILGWPDLEWAYMTVLRQTYPHMYIHLPHEPHDHSSCMLACHLPGASHDSHLKRKD